jgi:hypothetical protein
MLGGFQGRFDATRSITRYGASGDARDALWEARSSNLGRATVWNKVSMIFLGPSREIQQQYFKLNHDHFLLQLPQYTRH